MHKYKINNSYTVYVPNSSDRTDCGEVFEKKQPPLEWVRGTKVCNYSYGKGKITVVDDEYVTVHFYGTSKANAKKNGKKATSPIIITYKKEDAYKNLRLMRK